MSDMIVVMGGSFNPPTIAHLKLMQAALDQLTAYVTLDARGIFVPSSDAYVQRKMGKLPEGADRTVLPEKLRLDMLRSFSEKDGRLSVDERELGTTAVKGHTVETLQAIQQENPEADVLFIFGGDKLSGLPGWGSYEALVSQFKIILFSRGGSDLREAIVNTPALAAHAGSFVILRSPDGLDGISSTAVRERIKRGERADDLLTHEVYTMLLAERNRRENAILCFQGDYFFLSNFCNCGEFWWEFFPYRNAEAAFQSAKCQNDEDRNAFCHLDPEEAKRMGRKVELRPDWEEIKDDIMAAVVHEKFFQSESLARKLMATGDAELIEGNTWGDAYWGFDLHTMTGQNRLGKILMGVRDELNAIPQDKFRFRVKTATVDAWANDDIMDMVVASWKAKGEVPDHLMKLHPEPFDKIVAGKKTIELRLNDEKRQKVRVGDAICFTCTEDRSRTVTVRVLRLHHFFDFTRLYAALSMEKCGYGADEAADPSDMERYYSEEEQKRYGVLGIEFEMIRTKGGC